MVLVSKKSFSIDGLVRIGQGCDVDRDQVGGLSGADVGVEFMDIHDSDGLGDGDVEGHCLKGQCQLFSKDWVEIVRIYCGIVSDK